MILSRQILDYHIMKKAILFHTMLILLGTALGAGIVSLYYHQNEVNSFARIYSQYSEGNTLGLLRKAHQSLVKGDNKTAAAILEVRIFDGLLYGGMCLDYLQTQPGSVPSEFDGLVSAMKKTTEYINAQKIPNPHFTHPYSGPPHPLVKNGMVTADYVNEILKGKHTWTTSFGLQHPENNSSNSLQLDPNARKSQP